MQATASAAKYLHQHDPSKEMAKLNVVNYHCVLDQRLCTLLATAVTKYLSLAQPLDGDADQRLGRLLDTVIA